MDKNTKKAIKNLSEKLLKTFLKNKKIGFTIGLLIAFLITGKFGLAIDKMIAKSEYEININRQEILDKIFYKKLELEKLLKENEKRLRIVKKGYANLIEKADWYSKSWRPSYFFSIVSDYKNANNIEKDWTKNIEEDTLIEQKRKAFNDATNNMDFDMYSHGDGTTGWLTGNEEYNDNMEEYGYEDNFMITPTVKPIEVEEAVIPKVAFDMPNIPDIVPIDTPEIADISVGSINVSTPTITAPKVAPAPIVNSPTLKNVNAIEPNVDMNPISINITPTMPSFDINPVTPIVDINVNTPDAIITYDPDPLFKPIDLVEPNAQPFTDFGYSSTMLGSVANGYIANYHPDGAEGGVVAIAQNYSFKGGTYYSGIDPNTLKKGNVAGMIDASGDKDKHHELPNAEVMPMSNVSVTMKGRVTNPIYSNNLTTLYATVPKTISGVTLHIAGNDGTYTDNVGYQGTIGIHSAGCVNISNVKGYLYGRANFLTSEAWQAGDILIEDSTVNISDSDNAVFYIMPGYYGVVMTAKSGHYRGSFIGNLEVYIKSQRNSVYVQSGLSGSIKIENTGLMRSEGASNIIYSGLGYSPNMEKFGTGAPKKEEIMTSTIQFLTPAELYGDENIVMFFNTKWDEDLPFIWRDPDDTLSTAPFIGIYQGEIKVAAKIGDGTNLSGGSTQTAEGQLNNVGYGSDTVDGAVGILAKSGQRAGIIPSEHLGAKKINNAGQNAYGYFDSDMIHNLEIGNVDIRFGKNSKNGFMFISQLGTVIDIAKPGTSITEIGSLSSILSDGINGVDTKEEDAATGTIIAYSHGVWEQAKHKLGSDSVLASTDMTISPLEGESSEINIYIPVNMSSKEGIAYFADEKGKVNVMNGVDTTATGHKSIIGYARNYGEVTISGNITAVDAGATSNKYQNIGAYAGVNGKVTVDGIAEINGIGAFAYGIGSKVYLKNTGNIIKTGVNGGIAALNNGYVEFNGGTIEHKDIALDDHDGKISFYADDSSMINFTGKTTLNIYDGVVFYGSASDYTRTSGTNTKYNGMGNITVELRDNGVNLGVFEEQNIIWNGEIGYLTALSGVTQVNAINNNNYWYNSYLVGGTFEINFDVILTTPSSGGVKATDAFNDITLEREKIIIDSGITISSTIGYGLALGSNSDANKGANKNLDSGYTNNGTINISGKNKAGVYTSYGYIDNTKSGQIIVDEGIAVVGVNGSKITNNGTITVNATSDGIGIVGLARRINSSGVADNPEDYGTDVTLGYDADTTTNLIEIDNQGTITIAGTGGVAIYADNNIGGTRSRVVVKNNQALILGNDSVGVMVKGAIEGGTITLSDTVGTDITVGSNGIGIYGENSTITISGTPYEIEVKDNGIGIYTTGNSTLNAGDFKLNYTGNFSGTATGIVYISEPGKTLTNNINIQVATPIGMAGTVSGIYANGGGTLVNAGDIISGAEKAYGIISESVDVQNTGTIVTGVSDGMGGVGIYAIEANVSTDGNKLMVDGTNSVGVYATDKTNTLIVKTILISQGAGNLSVLGKNAVGIFIKDTSISNDKLILDNESKIDLVPSSTDEDRRIGIHLDGAKNIDNTNSAMISISGTATSGNNVGIYNKNSHLNQAGTITMTGIKNIGIFAESTEINASSLDLSGGTINVMTTTMADEDISIGVYGKGNNISITSTTPNDINVSPNSVGIYLEGGDSSTTNGTYVVELSSDVSGKIAVGAYYKGGASAAGTINLNSTDTASDFNGEPIRPIGLFYGDNSRINNATINILGSSQEMIGIYGKQLTSFVNNGDITLNAGGIGAYFLDSNVTNNGNINTTAENGYGLYFIGGQSTNNGIITANAANAVGVVMAEYPQGLFTNKNTIEAGVSGAIGIYIDAGGKFVNDVGATVKSTSSESIGIFSRGSEIENKGEISTSYVGVYVKDGGKITQTSGNIIINEGVGVFLEGEEGITDTASIANLNGGTITGLIGAMGIFGTSGGVVNLNGTNITVGNSGIGIHLDDATGKLISGNITVGTQGTALYAKDSNLDLTGYNGTLTLGDEGIGIYSDNNVITTSNPTTININYATFSNKAVGIYYKGTSPINNMITINHTGDNLVHIYADGINMTNNANQVVLDEGIGLFIDNGSSSSNTATLTLNGNNSIGIFIDNTGAGKGISTLTDIGTITGTPAATPDGSKIGIYVKNGDITGTSAYNFAIDGGIGIYLVNDVISYTGNINLTANSTDTNRAIGVYVSDTITGNLNNNINVTGANAIGMYLAKHPTLSQGADITYNGELKITSTGSTSSNRGVGAVLDNYSTLTLGASSKVEIGGTNNIGFYVKQGANLNIDGGTITNTIDGVFAYIEDGTIHFTSGSSININYANVIVSGTGSIINDTSINVGTVGLQASNGASILNSATGTINGTADEGKAMVGISGATIINDGNINLSGDKSIGIYVDGDAIATSNGNVAVGDDSVAYYAGENTSSVGGTININGTTSVGKGGTMIFANGGDINYIGSNIDLGESVAVLTLASDRSNVNFNGVEIKVGKKGIGVFITNTGAFDTIQNLSKIFVGDEAIGIFVNNESSVNTDIDIDILGQNGIGIFTTQNGDINYGGELNSNSYGAKGIISTAANKITNTGTIKLVGDGSIGIYSENTAEITNDIGATIEVGSGVLVSGVMNYAVGIYGNNINSINNNGTIKLNSYGVGIYGENSSVTNTGSIQSTSGNNTGIFGVGGSISNSGNIALGDTSNGLFLKNGTSISNTGNITVGDTKSSGMYGAGTTSVNHLSGTITVGKNSVGVASEMGTITVASGAIINAGNESTYIYTESGTGVSNTNLILNNYSVGMYTKEGSMTNNGVITVGKSDMTYKEEKISVGMATGTNKIVSGSLVYTGGGTIINNGTIDIPYDNGVGMIANNPTGTAINNGIINAYGSGSYGMQGSEKATLINRGYISVIGNGAKGIGATSGAIVINDVTGRIEVTGTNAKGIFAINGGEIWNDGEIIIDGSGRTGIYLGSGGVLKNGGTIIVKNGATAKVTDKSDNSANIGAITIDSDGLNITVGDKEYDLPTLINDGYIEYEDGPLDLGKIIIGSSDGHIGTINADSFTNGELIVLPTATQGDNKPIKVIQYLEGIINAPNNGELSAISQSVTWIADIQTDPENPNIHRIVLIKIPYAEITKGTPALEFGKGLDEIYEQATGRELDMFDAIDLISDKDELAAVFDIELRGNLYSNIQQRMLDVRENFEKTYEDLKYGETYEKDSMKIGAIMSGGETMDKNPGVEDYKYRMAGFMVLEEYDHEKVGRKTDWNIGFANTKFDFDYGSNETVYSISLGAGYEDYIGNSKNLKWNTRIESDINRHETERKIHLSNGTYTNKAKYWTYMSNWKNKIRYGISSESGNVRGGIFGTFNLGYGKIKNFEENGDGIYLDIKEKNMYTIRPGIGVDATYSQYVKNGKISMTGKVTTEYELGKMYDGANEAKIKGTSAGYYDLEEPEDAKGSVRVGVQLRYETKKGNSVGVDVTRNIGNVDSIRYGANFIYRF